MIFKNIKALPRGLIFSALALILILGTVLYFMLYSQAREYKREKITELQAALDYKTDQIQHWIQDQSANASLISDSPFLGDAVPRWRENPGDERLRASIQSRLNSWREYFGYSDVMLVDPDGNILLEAVGVVDVLAPETKAYLRQALAGGKYLLTDFYMCTVHHTPHIDVIAPLNPGARGKAGESAVILRISPRDYLYPLMKNNAFQGRTFETLLVRREGDSVLFLNDVRFAKDAALKLKVPLSKNNVPAGLEGKTVSEGEDYRGQKVLAVTGPVAGSNWAVVAKMDIKEVHSPLWSRVYIWGLNALLILIGSVSALSLIFLNQRKDYFKKLYTMENERQALVKHYDYLTKYANDIIFLLDENRRVVEINERGVDTYGYTHEELIGMDAERIRVEELRPQFRAQMGELAEKGSMLYETMHRRKDGSTFPVEISARTIEIEGKKYLQGIVRDITERKQAEEQIKSAYQNWMVSFNAMSDGISLLDAEQTILQANRAMADLAGRPIDQIIGRKCYEIIHAEGKPDENCPFARMLKNKKREQMELELRGRQFNVLTEPVIDEKSGRITGAVHIITDITERKLAEEQIKLAAKKWETTFDSIGDGVCLLDRQWKILQCNQAFTKMVGKPYDEILDCDCHELTHGPENPREFWLLTKMERSLRRETMELEHDGKYLLITADPIFDQQKNLVGAVHIISDISGLKLMEQELLQAQKMEAVGFLAGGVAHDFNNMLAGIVGNAELLQLKVYGQKELETYLDNILKASGHAAGLTKQLLAFARKGQYQKVPVNIHKVIAETLGILGNTIDRRIKIEQHLRANPAVILGDYSQLENALMNLGINARDAMPEGGKLIFSTEQVNLDEEYIRQHNYKIEPGHYLQITVEDTGSGMSDEVKRHLFEPFFTTKEKGRGTGLGLAGVYGCIKNHGGSIEVYSEPGRGTAIKLYLPLYVDLTAAGKPDFVPLKEMSVIAGTGSILIVDDEDMIRTIAAQILKTAGYQVQTCADGQEAVDLFAKDHSNIKLVIMDMVMPRLDGREAFNRMREINPQVKVLLSSGFSEDGDAQAILQEGALGFIQKPYRSAELLSRVQQALQVKNPTTPSL